MKLNKTNKALKIFSGISILLGLLALSYYFVIPKLVNIEKFRPKIRQILVENISAPVNLGKLDLETTWNFGVKIKTNSAVVQKKDGSNFVSIGDSSSIEVSMLPLLYKKIVIREIILNNLDGNITRLKDGTFDIGKIFIKKKQQKYKVELKNTSIIFGNYRINFTDKYLSPQKSLVLSGNNIKISKFTPGKYIEIETNSKISSKNGAETFINVILSSEFPFNKKNWTKNVLSLKGNIINFNLNELKPYFDLYFTRNFEALSGKGSVKFNIDLNKEISGTRKFYIDSVINNLNINDAAKGIISSYPGKLNFLTQGNFNDKDLFIDNFLVNGKNINSNFQGKISNFTNKKIRNVNLNISLNSTNVQTAAKIFPKYVKVPLDPFNKILKHNVDGVVTGNITAKGYYRRPELFGNIKCNQVSIIKKNTEKPDSSANVDFMGSKLVINSKQYLNNNEFVNTTGNISPFKSRNMDLSINSTQNIDFEESLPVLLAIRDIFNFKLRPITEMTIAGKGKVNLNIKGSFKNIGITGYVEVKNGTAKYITLAEKAENVNGKIHFTGDKVNYNEISGYVKGIKVIPSGYSTLKGYSDVKLYMPNLDFKKGKKFVYESPLLKEVQFTLKDIQDINGIADSVITISGANAKVNSTGIFKSNNAYVKYNGYAEPFSKIKGQFRYTMDGIFFDNLNGNVLTNNATVNGFLTFENKKSKDINMTVVSKNVNLTEAKNFVLNSFLLYKAQKIVKDFHYVDGKSEMKLVLNGNVNDEPLKELIFSNLDGVFNHKLAGVPVKISGGTIYIANDYIETAGIKANLANIDFLLKGKVSNTRAYIDLGKPLKTDIVINTDKFDVSNLKNVLNSPLMPAAGKLFISKFSNMQGFSKVKAEIKPSGYNLAINFDNFAAVYKPADLPVLITNGNANITEKYAYLNDIKGKIFNSDFYINGLIKNYSGSPSVDLLSLLEFNSDDADKFSSILKIPVESKGIIPIAATIKGNSDNWKILAKATFNKNTYLKYLKQIGLPDDKIRILTLDATGQKDRVDINDFKIDLTGDNNEIASKSPWAFNVLEEKENILNISGSIDRLTTDKPMFINFKIATNNDKPLSTDLFNPCAIALINNGNDNFFSDGTIRADLLLNGYVYYPDIKGSILLAGLEIPDLKLSIDNAAVNFNNNEINLYLNKLKIDDSIMNIHSTLDYSFELPLMAKNMHITSNFINIDKILKVFSANKNLINSQPGEFKLPYFVIKNGNLETKELIIHDLITSKTKADFSFTPDWLLSLSNINTNIAGGTAAGNVNYNTGTTELSLNLKTDNIEANALASTFLNLSNEVYGTLQGEGQFYTRGRNPEEMISNTNGYASFNINDARLVRLGSLEYFLRAANVLQSGIGGFNLNNIIDLVAPKKTGYFDYINGRIDVRDGVLSTEDITSSGENLSLFLSGNFDMLTKFANVNVLGKLSKKISGLLGPVGSLSINQFIDYIPGFGFLPTSPDEKGLIDLIPGLSKIPVLGLDGKQKYRQFAVDINGNLYDQKSVKSFRWLD